MLLEWTSGLGALSCLEQVNTPNEELRVSVFGSTVSGSKRKSAAIKALIVV